MSRATVSGAVVSRAIVSRAVVSGAVTSGAVVSGAVVEQACLRAEHGLQPLLRHVVDLVHVHAGLILGAHQPAGELLEHLDHHEAG